MGNFTRNQAETLPKSDKMPGSLKKKTAQNALYCVFRRGPDSLYLPKSRHATAERRKRKEAGKRSRSSGRGKQ